MADREVTCSRAWRLRSRGRPAFRRAASSWVKFTTSREGIRPRRSGSLSCQRVAASARLMRRGIKPALLQVRHHLALLPGLQGALDDIPGGIGGPVVKTAPCLTPGSPAGLPPRW